MWLIVVTLCIGFIIGYFNIIPSKLNKVVANFTTTSLILLLISMGIKIGIDHTVISNLGKLGLAASLLAVTSVIGSIICVTAVSKLVLEKDNNRSMKGETDDIRNLN